MGCNETRKRKVLPKSSTNNVPKINLNEISEIKSVKNQNPNVEYEKKLTKTNRTFLTNTTKETFLLEMEDNIPFPQVNIAIY